MTGEAQSFNRTMAGVGRELEQIRGKLKRVESQTKRAAKGFSLFKGAVATAGGTLAAAGVRSLARDMATAVKEASEYSASLVETSDNLKILPTRLEAIRNLLKQDGVGFATTNTALGRLNVNLANAKVGLETYVRPLRDLKLELKDVRGLNTEQAFYKIADALQKVENQQDRSRIATELFGRAGVKLLGTILKYPDAFKKAVDAQDGLSGAQDRDYRRLKDLEGKMEELQVKHRDRVVRFAADNAEAMEGYYKVIDKVKGAWVQLLGVVGSFLSGPKPLDALGIDELLGRLQTAKRVMSSFGDDAMGVVSGEARNTLEALQSKLRQKLYPIMQEVKVEVSGDAPAAAKAKRTVDDVLRDLRNETKREFWVDYHKAIGDTEERVRGAAKAEKERRIEFEKYMKALQASVVLRGPNDAEDETTAKLMTEHQQQIARIRHDVQGLGANLEGEVLPAWKDMGTVIDRIGESLKENVKGRLEDLIIEGGKFRNVLNAILKDMARMIARQGIINPAVDFVGGAIGGWVKGLFGGGKAAGGHVKPGRLYEVGEAGPEGFIPTTSGNIVSNSDMKRMRGAPVVYLTQNFNLDSYNEDQLNKSFLVWGEQVTRRSVDLAVEVISQEGVDRRAVGL